MSQKKLKKLQIAFDLASRLTDFLPEMGARLLDEILFSTAGSNSLHDWFYRRDLAKLRQIRAFDHLLVIADLNIGDAIIVQSGIAALREYFPTADIDFIINRAAVCFIDGNPDITTLYPVFTRAPIPDTEDLRILSRLCKDNSYDLIVNFSPFLKQKQLGGRKQPVLDYTLIATTLVRNQRYPERVNHVIWQTYYSIHCLLSPFLKPSILGPFKGTMVTLSTEAMSQAHDFLNRYSLSGDQPLILYNPDASSPFTRIPLKDQKNLLRDLLRTEARVMLGAGHVVPHIADWLLNDLPGSLRQKVSMIPATMPFDTYAALIDACDVFITGDSGALHVAAAWKRSKDGTCRFRNRTAVFAVFGATPARIYGYDSQQPGFLPANQEAPSRTYIAESPCRNITCINKMAKTCQRVRCFERMPMPQMTEDIGCYLRTKALQHSHQR